MCIDERAHARAKFGARCSMVRRSSTRSRSAKLKCSVLVLVTEHQLLEHCSSLHICYFLYRDKRFAKIKVNNFFKSNFLSNLFNFNPYSPWIKFFFYILKHRLFMMETDLFQKEWVRDVLIFLKRSHTLISIDALQQVMRLKKYLGILFLHKFWPKACIRFAWNPHHIYNYCTTYYRNPLKLMLCFLSTECNSFLNCLIKSLKILIL
jgi:hypothetical protein